MDNKMKTNNINNVNPINIKTDVSKKSGAGYVDVVKPEIKINNNEKVTLNNQLSALKEKIDSSSGFDGGKVSELKERISKGEYKIDFNQLASKIIDSEYK